MGLRLRYIPNTITAARFVLALLFDGLMLEWFRAKNDGLFVPLMLLFASVCLTDFIDGKAARALKAVTAAGAVLDVTADLFFILSSLLVLDILGKAPVWFTAVVIVKFIEFCMTSHILRRRVIAEQSKSVFISDLPGRISAVLFYLTPGVICLLYRLSFPGFETAALMFMTGAALLAFLSSVKRCIFCFKRRVKLRA